MSVSSSKPIKTYFISNEPNDDSTDNTGTTMTQVKQICFIFCIKSHFKLKICANDVGGNSIYLRNEWTSYLKLKLECTDEGLKFDVVNHMIMGSNDTLYGVFTTKVI